MKLIDLIKQLIKEANETGMVASKNAETAETQAMESFQLASWANKTTVSTRQVLYFFLKVKVKKM